MQPHYSRSLAGIVLKVMLCVLPAPLFAVPPDRPPALEEADSFQGAKLSLNFQDIEVRAVLQILADFNDMNLVVSGEVTGHITLRLQQVPWDQALDIILKTQGLEKRLQGNVLMIAPAENMQKAVQRELASRRQLAALAPIRTAYIVVKHARAEDIVELFQPGITPGGAKNVLAHTATDLSQGEGKGPLQRAIKVDTRTNTVIITDTDARIMAFHALLESLDVPIRQVLIEARIVTATTSFGKSLGIRWGARGGKSRSDGSPKTQFGGSLNTIAGIRNGIQSDTSGGENLIVDLGTSGNASSFAFGFVDDSFLLELELSAMETEGRGEVIARPKVITADQQQAWIASGDQIPYQESSSSGATSVQFIDAVLGLKVTPRITPNEQIILDLEVKQDSIGAVFNGVPSIRTNSIQTQVLVENEETIVLGGIFQEVQTTGVSKTPVLGDLPFIGGLFRHQTRTEDKQELLIFITPKLIRDI